MVYNSRVEFHIKYYIKTGFKVTMCFKVLTVTQYFKGIRKVNQSFKSINNLGDQPQRPFCNIYKTTFDSWEYIYLKLKNQERPALTRPMHAKSK